MSRTRRRRPLTPAEISDAAQAAERVVEIHRRLAAFLRFGITLAEVERFIARQLDALNCRSCFLGYRVPHKPPYPSHACLSVNDCVVHGTAAAHLEPLKPGDVLKVDIGVRYRGWIGDAAWTYVFGEPAEPVQRLAACGKEALRRGIERLRPGNCLVEWARTVQRLVEYDCGFHLIRGLGGHGYGRSLHEPPFVANVVPACDPVDWWREWPDALTSCTPGMLLAVEPMIALGTGQTKEHRRAWPVYTADGSVAVHFEHDVLVTDDGPRVLTAGLEEIPDVITT